MLKCAVRASIQRCCASGAASGDCAEIFKMPQRKIAAKIKSCGRTFTKIWCAREDLNLQSLRNQILSLACLPIPPRAQPAFQGVSRYFSEQPEDCHTFCD